MVDYLAASTSSFVSSVIQLLIGGAVAAIVPWTGLTARLNALRGAGQEPREAPGAAVCDGALRGRAAAAYCALASASCGAAVPLGPFGALPVAAAALSAGIGAEFVLAFIASNLLFNMLVPFTDPLFIWRTGYPRLLLALAAGLGAAFAARRARGAGRELLRDRQAPRFLAGEPGRRYGARLWIGLLQFWPFAAAGALAGTAFRDYGLGALMTFLFANPLTAGLPYLFAQADVTNPFFILATRLLMTLTDFVALAALAAICTFRGFIACFVYFTLLAALLGMTAFL